MVYNLSAAGLDLIKKHEGCKLAAYQDIAGVWTIGYGHTRTAKPGMVITEQQASDLLRGDVADACQAVNQLVTVPLEQREFDALVSFVFNLGRGGLMRFNPMTKAQEPTQVLVALNAGQKIKAAANMMAWHNAVVNGKLTPVLGLARRRAAEVAYFLG